MKADLSPEFLVTAYSNGYFPMPDRNGTDIAWYRPDPRAIIPLDKFHVSRSLKRTLMKKNYVISYDHSFREVMLACSQHPDTWITPDFVEAYCKLFDKGFAHSVEVWQEDRLVGGVYGPSIGKAFFAESMFHRVTDASKIALYFLVKRLNELNFKLLEIQFLTAHLASLGAIEIPDKDYVKLLAEAIKPN